MIDEIQRNGTATLIQLLNQGVSTFILICLGWFFFSQLPTIVSTAVNEIRQGYESNSRELLESAKTYEETSERMMRVILELARETHARSEALRRAVAEPAEPLLP